MQKNSVEIVGLHHPLIDGTQFDGKSPAHFYGVVKYENGVLFLHDPNIKNRVFKFRLVPYKSGPFESYQMIPLDSDYTIDRNFPPQLHYMINGLVTVEREN